MAIRAKASPPSLPTWRTCTSASCGAPRPATPLPRRRPDMLRHLLGFELGQLLRNGVFWIVVAVYALMGFGTMASDNVSIGGGVGNIMRNAPAVVISILGSFSVVSVLLATIFVAGIAIRDFEQRTAELSL